MTPTREQVIEWAKAANILEPIDLLESNQWRDDTIRELERLAALAYSAGRLKGLDEAKEAALATRDLDEEKRARDRAMAARGGDMENEVRKLDHYFTVVAYNAGLNKCAAAIDQLKDQK